MLSETNKTTARQRAERQGDIMTYIYAYKRLEETNNETADTILYSYNTTWNIAETISNMNESDFLQFIFNTPNVFGKVDKVRILEIIK